MSGYDSDVKLLLHGYGADASTTFTDSGPDALSTSAVGGNAQIDTAQSKFGGSSILFDGTGDYVRWGAEAGFSFGTGDFTIDFWVRFASVTGTRILYDSRTANGAFPMIYITGGVLIYHQNGNKITSAVALSTNTWYHVAVARSGTSTKMFQDGTQVGSTYSDSTNYSVGAGRPVIGINGIGLAADAFSGHIDELRVSKGVARWTGNFTPPTEEYYEDTPFASDGVAAAEFITGADLASAGVATAGFSTPLTEVVPTCSGYVPEVGADTFTLGNASIGEAIGARSLLALVSMAQGGDTTSVPSAVTYGGVGLTKLFDFNTTSGVCFSFSVWRLDNPSGTNADIVVTSAGAPSRVMLVSVFACYGLGALLDSATDDALTGAALDLSLNTELGGAVFALMGRYNNSNGSGGNWSVDFANERKALQFRGPFQEDGCSFDIAASTQTPRTVTATINNASGTISGVGGIAVSFSPGASGLEAP